MGLFFRGFIQYLYFFYIFHFTVSYIISICK
nr:MAG TPA: hypothetical protein [Caudoviricetes sp.]